MAHTKMVIYTIGKSFESIITINYNNGSKNPLLELWYIVLFAASSREHGRSTAAASINQILAKHGQGVPSPIRIHHVWVKNSSRWIGNASMQCIALATFMFSYSIEIQ
jgi:hypothetical protein